MTHKDFAIEIAKEAGEIIRKNFTLGMKKEWKSDLTPVAETDYRINTILIERVQKEFPDYGVLGEEESFNEKAENLWVCDPLDGTIPFSHGVPICTFALALVSDGEPVLGVVYEPFMDNLYLAEQGKGAYLNDKKIRVSEANEVKGGLINFDVWSRAPYYIRGLRDNVDEDGAITLTYASLAYCNALVATGEFIASVFAGKGAHDVAATKVIVEEAGGKVTDLWDKEQRYDRPIKGAIISNGKVHDYLIAKVKECLKSK